MTLFKRFSESERVPGLVTSARQSTSMALALAKLLAGQLIIRPTPAEQSLTGAIGHKHTEPVPCCTAVEPTRVGVKTRV